ncbi:hypothetical protein [Streptomyces sp. NPDC088923]|uniref:hypothetical protein n=1 Tax=Streptomyces sp. NPDC088923 TaxID=3365913 RepID=UPI0038251041
MWALVFGAWGLARRGAVWRDEAATWQVARRPVGRILELLGSVDAVHGAYYLLMHEVFAAFGPGTFVLRAPSVLAVAGAAGCVALLGRRFGGSGTTAGLALTVFPGVQFQAQEGRPYALVLFGCAVATLLFVAAVRGEARRGRWAAYGAVVLASALLNWLALLVLSAHLVTLCLLGVGREVWARWGVAAGGAVAGVAPLVLLSATQREQIAWIPPLTWGVLLGPLAVCALGGLAALPARRYAAGSVPLVAVALPLLVVPQVLLAVVSSVRPLFLERYVLFALLGAALLAGAAVDAAVRAVGRWLVPVLGVTTALALLPSALAERSPASRVDDVRAGAVLAERLGLPGDAVVFVPAARRDSALVAPARFAGLRDIGLARDATVSGTLSGVELPPAALRTALATESRVLLLTDAHPGPPAARRDRAKLAALTAGFTPVRTRAWRGRQVTVYVRRAALGAGRSGAPVREVAGMACGAVGRGRSVVVGSGPVSGLR